MLSREWRCSWSSADRRCSNYIRVISNLIAYQCASYIRDLTVYGIVAWALAVRNCSQVNATEPQATMWECWPSLCCHMATLGHNLLMLSALQCILMSDYDMYLGKCKKEFTCIFFQTIPLTKVPETDFAKDFSVIFILEEYIMYMHALWSCTYSGCVLLLNWFIYPMPSYDCPSASDATLMDRGKICHHRIAVKLEWKT